MYVYCVISCINVCMYCNSVNVWYKCIFVNRKKAETKSKINHTLKNELCTIPINLPNLFRTSHICLVQTRFAPLCS